MTNNYIFLKLEGCLKKKGEDSYDSDCVEALDKIITVTKAKIIIIDPPRGKTYIEVLDRLGVAGLQNKDAIIGQLIEDRFIEVKTPYDHLGLGEYPLLIGNNIKYWVDNFIRKPYNLNPHLKTNFEIWEKSEFKGMNTLTEGEHFKYAILSDTADLLMEQANNFIEINPNYGLNMENIKKIALYF